MCLYQDVKPEREVHIDEMAEEPVNHGFSEEEAVVRALAQMGDADLIGKQLKKQPPK